MELRSGSEGLTGDRIRYCCDQYSVTTEQAAHDAAFINRCKSLSVDVLYRVSYHSAGIGRREYESGRDSPAFADSILLVFKRDLIREGLDSDGALGRLAVVAAGSYRRCACRNSGNDAVFVYFRHIRIAARPRGDDRLLLPSGFQRRRSADIQRQLGSAQRYVSGRADNFDFIRSFYAVGSSGGHGGSAHGTALNGAVCIYRDIV